MYCWLVNSPVLLGITMHIIISNKFHDSPRAAITLQHLAHTEPDIYKKSCFCCYHSTVVIPIRVKMGKLALLDGASIAFGEILLKTRNNCYDNQTIYSPLEIIILLSYQNIK